MRHRTTGDRPARHGQVDVCGPSVDVRVECRQHFTCDRQLQPKVLVVGETKLRAGESVVLSDVSDRKRVIVVEIDVKGATHWRLAVELWR